MGANLGTFTRLAFERGAAKVVAFEPQGVYEECLRRTFSSEIASKRLGIVSSPVWSEKRTVHFAGQGLVGRVAEEGTTMQSVTLDEIVDRLALPRVDFLKADIEGAERQALLEAAGLIRRWRPRIAFCVYHHPDDPQVIRKLIQGYQPYKLVFDTSGRYVYAW